MHTIYNFTLNYYLYNVKFKVNRQESWKFSGGFVYAMKASYFVQLRNRLILAWPQNLNLARTHFNIWSGQILNTW